MELVGLQAVGWVGEAAVKIWQRWQRGDLPDSGPVAAVVEFVVYEQAAV